MSWLKRLFGMESSRRAAPPEAAGPKSTLEELTERYGNLRQPAIHLLPGVSGFSWLGGLPQMPRSFAWPQWKGKPQAFIAQLDLTELHAVMPSYLPPKGLLYFFYEQDQGVWGFDPKDLGGWQVLYHPGEKTECIEHPAPNGLPVECVYKTKTVRPKKIDLLPDSQKLERPPFDWERDGEAYDELRRTAFAGQTHHQVHGFPTPVQNDDMELECQLASNGIYVGNQEGYQDSRVPGLKEGTANWKLLLQVDSDDDTGWMWGDVGTLYFWVRESDARQGDFSKVWMVFQCC